MKEAEEKAALIIEKARSQQKDLILEAKEEKIRLQREAEDEARAKRTELANLERRLLQRDEQLDQRADMLEERDRKLIDRERELDRPRGARPRTPGAGRGPRAGQRPVRRRRQGDPARGGPRRGRARRGEAGRSIERRAREEADDKARDVIVTAIQRVAADHTAEHTVTRHAPAVATR